MRLRPLPRVYYHQTYVTIEQNPQDFPGNRISPKAMVSIKIKNEFDDFSQDNPKALNWTISHQNEPEFENCGICKKTYLKGSHICVAHQSKRIKKETMVQCPECNKLMQSRSIKKHKIRFHTKKQCPDTFNKRMVEQVLRENQIKCLFCDKFV